MEVDLSKKPLGSTDYIIGAWFDETHIQWLIEVDGGYLAYSQTKQKWVGLVTREVIANRRRTVIKIVE